MDIRNHVKRSRTLLAGSILALIGGGIVASAVTSHASASAQQPGQDDQHPNFDGFWLLQVPPQDASKKSPPDLPEGWRAFGTQDWPAPSLQRQAYEIVKTQRIKEEKAVTIAEGLDEKTARCEAGGFPDFLEFDLPLDIVQRPDEIVMLTERERQLPRHIYISPPHPISLDYLPARTGILTHNGHSLAHWEGNTLVVDTDGFDPSPWMFSIDRIPHSDAMTTVERLSLSADGNILVDRLEITDPKTLTEVWKLRFTWHRAPTTTEAIESTCDIDLDYLGIKGNSGS